MTPDVLERNVARLFAAAWRPVEPTARSRANLEARLRADIEARLAAAITSRAGPARAEILSRSSLARLREDGARRGRGLRLAAAALLLLAAGSLAAWLSLAGRGLRGGPEELLARGLVALLEADRAGTWRAADERELARGHDAGAGAAAARTPEGTPFTLHLGASGRVELEPSSAGAISAASPDGARAIELDGAGARVRRDDTGPAWTVTVPGGAIALERGILEWRAEAGGPDGARGHVTLRSGIAYVLDGARSALVPGVRAWLADGAIAAVTVTLAGADGPASARRAASEPAAPAPERASPPVLSGELALPDGAAVPERFRVTLLRRVRLPEVSEPASTSFAGTRAFRLEGLQPGTYEVLVEAPGCAVARRTDVEVAPHGETRLVLALAPERTARGRVVDAESGAPIAGAVVLAEELVPAQVVPFDADPLAAGWSAAAVTDADGAFVLGGLGSAAAHLRVSARGRGARWGVVPAGSRDTELEPLALAPGGAVHGRVTRADGRAWTGAIVIASRLGAGSVGERMSFGATQSDADGRYRIEDLPAGGYVVFAFDPAAGGVPATRDLSIRGTEEVEKDLGPTERHTRVSGVARGPDGAPLAGLDVLLGYAADGPLDGTSWISARTDDAGRFAFEGVEPRRYEVFAGRALGTSYARVDAIDVPLAPEFRHDLALPGGLVQGRVLGVDGAPAADAWIILLRLAGTEEEFVGRAQTDARGGFELLGLAPGTYAVSAHAETTGVAAVRSAPFEVGTGAARVELRCTVGVELVVRALDERGAPLPAARVTFRDEAGTAWQFTASGHTDARGILRVPGIAPGRWRIAVEGAAEKVLDVELGPRVEVELRTEGPRAPADPAQKDEDGR